jgi:hypothetical protein
VHHFHTIFVPENSRKSVIILVWTMRNKIRITSTASPREQLIIFHLCPGDCRLQHHLHHKFGIGESDMCPSNTEPMPVDHALTRCPKLATLMEEIWPNGSKVQEQLHQTTMYITEAGQSI